MIMNEHQLSLWGNMLKSIEDFRKGKIQYYDFVGTLEGSLQAGDFDNKLLIEQWYDHWTPLEILRAQKGNDVSVEEASKYISDMELFLRGIAPKDVE